MFPAVRSGRSAVRPERRSERSLRSAGSSTPSFCLGLEVDLEKNRRPNRSAILTRQDVLRLVAEEDGLKEIVHLYRHFSMRLRNPYDSGKAHIGLTP